MGKLFKQFIEVESKSDRVFACYSCNTHFTSTESIISREFRGQHGKAYLFRKAVNVVEGELENRSMTTGVHTVRDVSCSTCNRVVGWRYVTAFEESQKYKEGKYILERAMFVEI